MSILLFGQTICPLCRKIINEGDQFYSFPAFVINTKDPFYFFNDVTFHLACLQKNDLGITAINLAETFKEKMRPANRKCLIKGNTIKEPENHIFIDYLTMDKSDFLYRFNFTHIDKRNLTDWNERLHVIDELEKLNASDKWHESNDGKYLSQLIVQLKMIK